MAVEAELYIIDGDTYVKVSDLVQWLIACRDEKDNDEYRNTMSNMIISLAQVVSKELESA